MTKKRFIDGGEECVEDQFLIDTKTDTYYWIDDGLDDIIELLNKLEKENEQLKKENKELKFQNGDLLYQIGEVGQNNKTCRECECFIPEHNICWMWDMEVEANDIVVACDQRKIKKQMG